MARREAQSTAACGNDVDPSGLIKQPHGGALRPFKPGQIGNPTGANNYNRMVALLRQDSFEAAQELIRLRQDEDARVRFMAVEAVLNRAWGKPKERAEPDAPAKVFDPSKLTKAEKELLRKMLDKSFVKAPEPSEPLEIEGKAEDDQ